GTVASGSGVKEPIEARIRTSKGEYRWLAAIANNRLDDPLIRGIVVMARDVTEQRLTSDALKTSEARLRAILDNSIDIITVVDKKGDILLANDAGERLLGYSAKEGKLELFEHLHPDDRPRAERSIGELFGGATENVPRALRVADVHGDYHFIESAARNL